MKLLSLIVVNSDVVIIPNRNRYNCAETCLGTFNIVVLKKRNVCTIVHNFSDFYLCLLVRLPKYLEIKDLDVVVLTWELVLIESAIKVDVGASIFAIFFSFLVTVHS